MPPASHFTLAPPLTLNPRVWSVVIEFTAWQATVPEVTLPDIVKFCWASRAEAGNQQAHSHEAPIRSAVGNEFGILIRLRFPPRGNRERQRRPGRGGAGWSRSGHLRDPSALF